VAAPTRLAAAVAIAVAVVLGLLGLLGGAGFADDAGVGAPAPIAVSVDAGLAGPLVDAGAAPVVISPVDAALAPVDATPVDAALAPIVTTPVDAALAPVDATPVDAAFAPVLAAPVDAAPLDAAPLDGAPLDAAPLDGDAGPPSDANLGLLDPPGFEHDGPADAGLIVGGAPTEVTPPPPATHDRAAVVIRLVLGLMALFVVAYLGGHRRVVKLQERLGISGLIAAGFPFVALGVIVRQPAIGILTTDVLDRFQPILHFGLGWLGFIIGAQLDFRVLDRVPKGTAYLIVVEAIGPFAATAAACAVLAQMLGLSDWHTPEFWRDAIVVGAAGAMTAPRKFRGFANRSWREGRGVDQLVSQLDEIVGVIGLLFVAAYFRPTGSVGWQIPGTAWLFVAIGLGVTVGVLIFAMVRVPDSEGEFAAVVIGSVALGAGLAGYLFLSPIVVCFIAGALVINFPCEQRDAIFRILNHLERPIHLLFLIVAGASWNVTALSPWLIVPAFAVARIAGKWMGATTAISTVGKLLPTGFTDSRVLVSPLSPLAIALVVSMQGSAGGSPSPWLVTVVIGGAILTELAVQLTGSPTPRASSPAPTQLIAPDSDRSGPVDELDDGDTKPSGPVYRDELDDDDGGKP